MHLHLIWCYSTFNVNVIKFGVLIKLYLYNMNKSASEFC